MSFWNPSSPFSIFNIFSLLGGLALFLYGMKIMSQGLEKLAGGKLESILGKMTNKPIKALILGAGITATIQSSSAVTVMLVGLVNSGIMKLGQSVGVIMGTNIGTTITAWILSLAGIDSENIFISLLKCKYVEANKYIPNFQTLRNTQTFFQHPKTSKNISD